MKIFLSCLLLALALAGCPKSSAPSGPGGGAPVPVVVAAVEKQSVPLELRAVGNIVAVASVAIKPQVNGELAGVHFTEGAEVRAGDLLFTIDPRPFEAALKQAEANVERDNAVLKNAKEQLDRYTELSKTGSASKEQFDQIRSAAASALAALRADEAARDNAKLQLEYCTIRAPIAGRTGALLVNAGNIVKVNETVLATLNQIAPIYAEFAVPEQHAAEIRRLRQQGGLAVTVAPSGDGAREAAGGLSFVDNAVDPATGTIKLRATFANDDQALWPGEFVTATLRLGMEENAVTVPGEAVQNGQRGQFVYVVKADRTAEMRPVSVGREHGALAVVKDGVKPGETVVTDGQFRLVPGARVEIKNAPEPASAPQGK